MQPATIKSKIQLVVEGKDYVTFFEAFLDHLEIADVQIQNYGSVDELRVFLPLLAKTSNFDMVQRLGVVRDAESSAASAVQSVRSALGKANLALPEGIGAVAAGEPTVSVLVLPEDGPGMLETVLACSFAETNEDECIDGFFECIKSGGGTIRRPAKARTCAYLATTNDPQVSVGVAAKKGVWDFEHAAFTKVREFLSRLGAP